nr:hypothetical protein 6 [bacterium]
MTFFIISWFIARKITPVYFTEEGLKSYNFWGKYHEIPYEQLSGKGYLNIFILKYHVFTDGNKKIYVPTDITDYDIFKNIIEEKTGLKLA